MCAGLPGAKYLANADPEGDWANTRKLAQALSSVRTKQLILISTVDVYAQPVGVDEGCVPAFDGSQAYGRNRAWFEAFVRSAFSETLVVRLPALYGDGLRKNLVFDLLQGRTEQFQLMPPDSQFQFFDVGRTWEYVEKSLAAGLSVVNLATEPLRAQEVASLFGVKLLGTGQPVLYDVRSRHARVLGGDEHYLSSRSEQMEGISELKNRWTVDPAAGAPS